MNTQPAPTASDGEVAARTPRDHIARIVRALSVPSLGTGTLASLRRGDPSMVLRQAAFYRMASSLDDSELRGENGLRWATVVHCIAVGPKTNPPVTRGMGDALADAGYSESRFARLLSANGEAFRDQAILVARFLRAHDKPCSWLDLSELVLVESRSEKRAEQLRLNLARDYYRTLDRIVNR